MILRHIRTASSLIAMYIVACKNKIKKFTFCTVIFQSISSIINLASKEL